MSNTAMHATDHDILKLMHHIMHESGVSAVDLADLWDCDPSTVYRIARGESVPSAPALQRLAQRRRKTTGYILDYMRRGTDWLTFEIKDEPATQIDRDLIANLRGLADLMDQRRKDMEDGAISADEREQELALLDRLIGRMHELRVGVAEQTIVTRRKARPPLMRMVGKDDGGAA